jgi:hypothetical protein
MGNPDLDRLAAARHVALTTYRKDGEPVSTCVWIAREGDSLFVLTHAGSGKVKRIRRNARVELAPSDGRGRPQGGSAAAQATIADDPESVKRVTALIRRRYGIQYPLLRGLMGLRGRKTGRPIAIRIVDPEPLASHPVVSRSNQG